MMMKSLFKSEQGKREILALYDEKLKELAIAHHYLTINTNYGATNIIVTGKPFNPPIILIHGSNACAPISLETYPSLSDHFCVYAIDVLAQPNKSAHTRLSMKDDSYGQWINEVIDSLNIENITLVGFSFGGFVVLKTLEYDESRIREVYLAAPAYIENGNPLKALFRIFLPMKMFTLTKRSKYVEKFLAELFTERNEFAINYLSKVFLHFKMNMAPVPVISDKKAKLIETPIILFAGKNDILFPGDKMIERAKRIFPSLKSSVLFEVGKHVQSKAQNESIEKAIVN